jgi:uncharacterized protein with GYD domain
MPKYLIQGEMTQPGLERLLKEGGSRRRANAAQTMEGLGGSLEAFYYAFGETDAYLIVDLPDNVSAASLSLLGNGEGTRDLQITVLITPEEVDQATEVAKEMSVAYRPAPQ